MASTERIQVQFEKAALKLISRPPPFSLSAPSANENEIIVKEAFLTYFQNSTPCTRSFMSTIDGPYKGIVKLFQNRKTKQARLSFRGPKTSHDISIEPFTKPWTYLSRDNIFERQEEDFLLCLKFDSTVDARCFDTEFHRLLKERKQEFNKIEEIERKERERKERARKERERKEREEKEIEKEEMIRQIQIEKEKEEQMQKERDEDFQKWKENEKENWKEFEKLYKSRYEMIENLLATTIPKELMEDSTNPVQQHWWKLRLEGLEQFKVLYETRKSLNCYKREEDTQDILLNLHKGLFGEAIEDSDKAFESFKKAQKEYLTFIRNQSIRLKSESHQPDSQEERNCLIKIAKNMVKIGLIQDPEGNDADITRDLIKWKDWIKTANQSDVPLPPFPMELGTTEQQTEETKEKKAEVHHEKNKLKDEKEEKAEYKQGENDSVKEISVKSMRDTGTDTLRTSTKKDAETQTIDFQLFEETTTPARSNSASQTEAEKLTPTMSNSASQTETHTVENGTKIPDLSRLVKALNDTLDELLFFHQSFSTNSQEKRDQQIPKCYNKITTFKNEVKETKEQNGSDNCKNQSRESSHNNNPKFYPSQHSSGTPQVCSTQNSQMKALEEKINSLASDFAQFDKKLFIQPKHFKPRPRPYSFNLQSKPPSRDWQNPFEHHLQANQHSTSQRNIPKLMELKIEPPHFRPLLFFSRPENIYHHYPVRHMPFQDKELLAYSHPHTWRCVDGHQQRLVWCSKTHRPRRLERG